MSHSALELQKEVYLLLENSTTLQSLLPNGVIYDRVPSNKKPPYISFGDYMLSDWSTGTEDGIEHAIVLNIWSDKRGRKEVLKIASALLEELHCVNLTLTNHHLINFTHEFTEVGMDEEQKYFLAKVNFRAVTEPKQS